jgi:hypothetical protein
MPNDLEPQTVDTPLPVKLVSLLALLVGIFSILGGILLITAAIGNVAGAGLSHLMLILYGVFYLIIGFIALAVYKGLKRGEPWARTLFTVVLVIAIIGDVTQILIGGTVSSAWWGIAIDVIALVVLYGPESSRKHFEPKAIN